MNEWELLDFNPETSATSSAAGDAALALAREAVLVAVHHATEQLRRRIEKLERDRPEE